MINKDFSIVFMGTPQFAVTILDKIISEGYNVKAVVTATDKPAGRGRKIQESEVKQYAKSNQLRLMQPENLKDDSFIDELKKLKADLFVVVAFRMLPKVVWEIPEFGTINLHGSLLPQYRGAAPINWAVIHGEKKTGVTTFFINDQIDTGDILLQAELCIEENETAGDIHDKMMHLGAETVVRTIQRIRENKADAIPQPLTGEDLRPAPKIFREDCRIDLRKDVDSIHNFIRGLSPYPASWIRLRKKDSDKEYIFKVFEARKMNSEEHTELRLAKIDDKLVLHVFKGTLELQIVQLEGKKRMDSKQFLTGFDPEHWELVS
ncbi:MAG: methionyl-tRNA formyltransferase [Brumimicrobium sp.]|nr:methionyl-tRNA formyltransferase [Brumimicrobium sp.]